MKNIIDKIVCIYVLLRIQFYELIYYSIKFNCGLFVLMLSYIIAIYTIFCWEELLKAKRKDFREKLSYYEGEAHDTNKQELKWSMKVFWIAGERELNQVWTTNSTVFHTIEIPPAQDEKLKVLFLDYLCQCHTVCRWFNLLNFPIAPY